ncbi:4629_t:CDS:2, partial [Entrophospora sp. SA101]
DKRRGAILCKRNQKGVDLIIPIYEKESRKIGTILIQEDLANELKDNNNLGLLLHVVSAYANDFSLKEYYYDEIHKQLIDNPSQPYELRNRSDSTCNSCNRLVACGLEVFNLAPKTKEIFENLLCSWTDPIRFARENNVEHLLYRMMSYTYSRKRLRDYEEYSRENIKIAKKEHQ